MDELIISDFKDHVRTKGHWAGSIERVEIPDLFGLTEENKVIKLSNSTHCPALLKIIYEIIDNAFDHWAVPNNKVTFISSSFDMTTGEITVKNNGKGMPIKKIPNHDIYFVEGAFTKMLAGTNIKKQSTSIKGGTNGMGAKIANVHSSYFQVTTVSSGKKYVQLYKDHMNIINPPEITKTTDEDYTEIKFTIDFKSLKYDLNKDAQDLDIYIRMRMATGSVYTYTLSMMHNNHKAPEIIYNDKVITKSHPNDYINMFGDNHEIIGSTQVKQGSFGLYIVVMKRKKTTGIKDRLIINGIVCKGGTPLNYIKNQTEEEIKKRIKKDIKTEVKTLSFADIKYFIVGTLEGVDWSSQSKEIIQVKPEYLEKFKIKKEFFELVYFKVVESLGAKKVKTDKIVHDKYLYASNSKNPKKKNDCMLLVAEGDSAMTLLRTGLTQKCNKNFGPNVFAPTFEWLGIISVQGVIINSLKHSTSIEDNSTLNDDSDSDSDSDESVSSASSNSITILGDKLRKNKRLTMLADAFGLVYGCTYETPEEIAKLKYGKMIICTDQDLDGTGKICSLILVWIYRFWPNLLKIGKVGKLMTPIIRIFNKTQITEFYYESEFEKYISDNPDYRRSQTMIKYYKGLASHDTKDAARMFTKDSFMKMLYMFDFDKVTSLLFDVYFGKSSLKRKEYLVTPVREMDTSEINNLKETQLIPIGSVQLDVDTKLYKKEAINRQMPHAMDGMTPARRKILCGSFDKFGETNKELKVYQLAGIVSSTMSYHHAVDSLYGAIVGMAQNFKDTKKYPCLTGIGQFGDRHGSKAGSPRYISVKLNSLAGYIYRKEDKYILKYVFVDGERAEPKYFVPILPMGILETSKAVTEGWNTKIFTRKLEDVLTLVKAYINNEDKLIELAKEFKRSSYSDFNITKQIKKKYPLEFDGNNVEIKNYVEYSNGSYIYDKQKEKITITELPNYIKTDKYKLEILKNDKIKNLLDISSAENVELEIQLIPGSQIGNTDDEIKKTFKLSTSHIPNINFYACDDSILEFKRDYHANILYWAPIRVKFYKIRLVRQKILTNFAIKKETTIMKFIELSNKLDINMKDHDGAIKIFEENDLRKINAKLLSSPGYLSNEELLKGLSDPQECTYEFLFEIKIRELTTSSVAKRQLKIDRLNEEYENILAHLEDTPFPGAKLWLNEIEQFEKEYGKNIS